MEKVMAADMHEKAANLMQAIDFSVVVSGEGTALASSSRDAAAPAAPVAEKQQAAAVEGERQADTADRSKPQRRRKS